MTRGNSGSHGLTFSLSHKQENGYSKQATEEKRRREWVSISVENQHVGIPFLCQFLHCVGEEEKEKKKSYVTFLEHTMKRHWIRINWEQLKFFNHLQVAFSAPLSSPQASSSPQQSSCFSPRVPTLRESCGLRFFNCRDRKSPSHSRTATRGNAPLLQPICLPETQPPSRSCGGAQMAHTPGSTHTD